MTIKLFGLRITFNGWWETLFILKDTFIRQEYEFKTTNKDPLIIDCGAHIGITALYFKKKYPFSRIIAFEPNPKSFKLLKINVKQNKLTKVKLINAALSDKNGSAILYSQDDKAFYSWGDTLTEVWSENSGAKTLTVKTVKLSKFLTEVVDFLKIDIEGSEGKVFKEIKDKIQHVKEIAFEHHGVEGDKTNNLDDTLGILKRNNFSIKIIRSFEKDGKRWSIVRAKNLIYSES